MVVMNGRDRFSRVWSDNSASVLDQPALKGNGCRKEQSIQLRTIKALPNIRAGSQHQQRLCVIGVGKTVDGGLSFLRLHRAGEDVLFAMLKTGTLYQARTPQAA